MDSLSEQAFYQILVVLMKNDKLIREKFLNLLLHLERTKLAANLQLANDFIDFIRPSVQQMYPNQVFSKNTLTYGLMKTLTTSNVYSFIRLLKTWNKLMTSHQIPQTYLYNYMSEIGFSKSKGVDLYGMSRNVLDHHIYLEKKFIELINTDKIDFLLNFNKKTINILTRLLSLSENDKEFILSLNDVERKLFATLNPDRIRSLLYLEPDPRTLVLNLKKETRDGLKNFQIHPDEFMRTNIKDNPNQNEINLFNEIVQLDDDMYVGLKNMIEQRGVKIILLPPKAEYVAARINDLTESDRHFLSRLTEDQLDVLRTFTDEESLENVFKSIGNLTKKGLDLLRSLTRAEIQTLMAMGSERKISKVANLTPSGRSKISKLTYLDRTEEELLFQLKPEQRSILSKIYRLRYDGIHMISQLTLRQIDQVLKLSRGEAVDRNNFNLIQESLCKRIQFLDPEDKEEILDLNMEQLNSFFNLNSMGDYKLSILLNLSWEGIITLRNMAPFTQEQLAFIRITSRSGLLILANNMNLTPEEIDKIQALTKEEAELVLNLNLKQRYYLRHTRRKDWRENTLFYSEQISSLKRMSNPTAEKLLTALTRMTVQESVQLQELLTTETMIINTLNSNERDIFIKFNQHQIQELANIFDWHIEKELVFKIWQTLLDPELTLEQRKHQLNSDLQRAFQQLKTDFFDPRSKLIRIVATAIAPVRMIKSEQFIMEIDLPNMIETLDRSFFANVFSYHLINFFHMDNVVGEYSEQLLNNVVENPQVLEYVGAIFDPSDIEDHLLLRWRLSQSLEPNGNIYYQLSRENLYCLAIHGKVNVLEDIINLNDDIPLEKIMKALKVQLKDERYTLSLRLFYAAKRYLDSGNEDSKITKLFTKILDPTDYLEILALPVTQDSLSDNSLITGINFRRNILRDENLKKSNLLECSLYYNRGDPLPFLRELQNQDFAYLFDKNPKELIRYCSRYGRIDLLRFFASRVEETRLLDIVKSNDHELFKSIFNNVKMDYSSQSPLQFYKDIGHTIRWFEQIDSNMDKQLYLTVTKQFIATINLRVSSIHFDNIVGILVTDRVSWNNLIGENENLPDSINAPSCSHGNRRKRAIPKLCIDSLKNKKPIAEIGLERSNSPSRETNELFDFYQDLMTLLKFQSKNDMTGTGIRERLTEGIRTINVVGQSKLDIVRKLVSQQSLDISLKSFGVAEKIELAAGTIGLLFTGVLIGKHIANGDFRGIGFDALNLWVMPKLGQQVTIKLTPLSKFAPIIGRVVGNFGVFLGLVDALVAKKNSKTAIAKDLANVNIITNAAILTMDVPYMLSTVGLEFGILTEFLGPGALLATVALIVISNLAQISIQIKYLNRQIGLTFSEKSYLYWYMFWHDKLPKDLEEDLQLSSVYNNYIQQIVDYFQGRYKRIAISLPAVLITELDRQQPTTQFNCNFKPPVRLKNPLHLKSLDDNSRLLPSKVGSHRLVCSPKSKDIAYNEFEKSQSPLDDRCTYPKFQLEFTELYIPFEADSPCTNAVVFDNELTNSSRLGFYTLQNARVELNSYDSIDVIALANTITVIETPNNDDKYKESISNYYFLDKLQHCEIYKRGLNFIYTNDSYLNCDLGDKQQNNTVVIKNDFRDSLNIHSIVGNGNKNIIQVSHAKYVDGQGGNDIIRTNNVSVVKSYLGDSIYGPAIVLLPINVFQIEMIVRYDRIVIYERTGDSIEIDNQSLMTTKDEFLLTPVRVDTKTHLVTDIHLHKHIDGNILYESEIQSLSNIKNPFFNIIKQLSSNNYEIFMTDRNHHLFFNDKDSLNYYWEVSENSEHVYLFNNNNCNITISRANGILDFRLLNVSFDNNFLKNNPQRDITINHERLHITLLSNYQNIHVTFNDNKYYKLINTNLERDYCSHSLLIDRPYNINGTDLLDHLNCFEFTSNRVLFFKNANNLLLISNEKVLSIKDYYTIVHEKLELSIRLHYKIIRPEVFVEHARLPHSLRHYRPVKNSELSIYHNQPFNQNEFGIVNFNDISPLDCNFNIENHHLIVSCKRNNNIIFIHNWNKTISTRQIMFVFENNHMFNVRCFTSYCDPEYIVKEIQTYKNSIRQTRISQRVRRSLDATSSASSSQFWMNNWANGFVNAVKDIGKIVPWKILSDRSSHFNQNDYSNLNVFTIGNVGLGLSLLSNYLDRKYPLPQFRPITHQDILSNSINLIDRFKQVLNNISKQFSITDLDDIDFYDIYQNIVDCFKQKEYSQMLNVLYTAGENIHPDNQDFQRALKASIDQIINNINYLS